MGKTTLVLKFLEEFKKKVYINCSWFPNVKAFAYEVYRILQGFLGDTATNQFLGRIQSIEDPELVLVESLRALSKLGEQLGEKIPIALDEFQVFLENVSKKMAKVKRVDAREVRKNILWLLKALVEEGTVMWILLSSVGWEKVRELMLLKGEEPPVLGVFDRIEVGLMNVDDCVKLVRTVRGDINEDVARTIAEISGDIPAIAITIASSYTGGPVLKLAYELTRRGEFDDFFINIVKFISELSRRDFGSFITVLKALADGKASPTEISKHTGLEASAVQEILDELLKNGIVDKRRVGRRVQYEIRYPLMAFWLRTSKEFVKEAEREGGSNLPRYSCRVLR